MQMPLPSSDSDIVSLILVVFLFIFCNFTALLVNFLELTFAEQLKHVMLFDRDLAPTPRGVPESDRIQVIVYLVDLSNLLVVINCTANFFVYLLFGRSFRCTLRKICWGKGSEENEGQRDGGAESAERDDGGGGAERDRKGKAENDRNGRTERDRNGRAERDRNGRAEGARANLLMLVEADGDSNRHNPWEWQYPPKNGTMRTRTMVMTNRTEMGMGTEL